MRRSERPPGESLLGRLDFCYLFRVSDTFKKLQYDFDMFTRRALSDEDGTKEAFLLLILLAAVLKRSRLKAREPPEE